jgi:hypothetical protein
MFSVNNSQWWKTFTGTTKCLQTLRMFTEGKNSSHHWWTFQVSVNVYQYNGECFTNLWMFTNDGECLQQLEMFTSDGECLLMMENVHRNWKCLLVMENVYRNWECFHKSVNVYKNNSPPEECLTNTWKLALYGKYISLKIILLTCRYIKLSDAKITKSGNLLNMVTGKHFPNCKLFPNQEIHQKLLNMVNIAFNHQSKSIYSISTKISKSGSYISYLGPETCKWWKITDGKSLMAEWSSHQSHQRSHKPSKIIMIHQN